MGSGFDAVPLADEMSFWTAYGLPDPATEFLFHHNRKWRFDYAWFVHNGIAVKIAIEIDGGIWTHGAHVRGKHYLSDMTKLNEAAKLGWRVFRFTPEQFKKGVVQAFLLDLPDFRKT